MSKNITLHINGKISGVVRDAVLDIRKSSLHYVRKYGAYGVSPETLDEAEALGAEIVQLTVQESGKQFTCTVEEFRRYAITDNLGYGKQLFMALRYFPYCPSNKAKLAKNEPVPVQFTLWGG